MRGARLVRCVPLAGLTLAILLGAPPAPAEHAEGSVQVFWRFPARLGIRLQSMTEELREYFQVPPDRGVLVVRVQEGKPAHEAGVRVGDVLLAIDGSPVDSAHDVILAVGPAPSDEPLRLEIVREGKRLEIDVTPEGDPVRRLDPEPWHEFGERLGRGLERGRRELERRLRDLERRFKDLERRLDESLPPGAERT